MLYLHLIYNVFIFIAEPRKPLIVTSRDAGPASIKEYSAGTSSGVGWGVLKSVSLMGKQKLFENKTFKAIMGSLIKQDSREERELVTSSVYLEICLVMLFPMITT